jgi:hypothetical protein
MDYNGPMGIFEGMEKILVEIFNNDDFLIGCQWFDNQELADEWIADYNNTHISSYAE